MSVQDTRSIDKPAAKPVKPHGNTRIQKPVAAAIELMVHEGLKWNDAAQRVNLPTRTMRLALEKPHVLAYLRNAKDVFRASVSAANIHHLAKIRDASGNAMAQLGAIKVLEQIETNSPASSGTSQSPGVVVIIQQAPALIQHEARIDAKPLITLDHVHNGE